MSASIVQDPKAWSGVCVLVAGAPGIIGSHLVSRLTGSGRRTRVSRRYGTGPEGPAWHVADLTASGACVQLVGTVATARRGAPPGERTVTGDTEVDMAVPLIVAIAAAVNFLTAVAQSADRAHRIDRRADPMASSWYADKGHSYTSRCAVLGPPGGSPEPAKSEPLVSRPRRAFDGRPPEPVDELPPGRPLPGRR